MAQNHINSNDDNLYIDARILQGLKVGIHNLGTDKATRRKYLKNIVVKDFYKENILYPVREKLNNGDINFDIFIYCHQGKHKSVCLAEQLYKDLYKKHKITITHQDIST